MSCRIAHLSDLHFGRIETGAPEALLEALHAFAPRLILVSGDLTQRAFAGQFAAARDFLRRLPVAPVCVPGNHDVPLLNPLARFAAPLRAYRRSIDACVDRFHEDDDVALVALNTAHGFTTMHGRLDRAQAGWTERHLAAARAPVRIVMTHHPLDLPDADRHPIPSLVPEVLPGWIDRLRIDLFLAGHLHRSRTLVGPLRTRATRRAVFAQAGTTTSTRHYAEVENAFNGIEVDGDAMRIAHWRRRDRDRFVPDAPRRFARDNAGWSELV